jgi:magnesium chelatase family protein
LPAAIPGEIIDRRSSRDFADVKGQERAKRAFEIAAAGRHHLLLVGPPGSGKSMMAARLPGLLPPLEPAEALATSMIHSVAGLLDDNGISRERPFRSPHHTASMAAIVGGGRNAKPGEISLAHNGVLFLDKFPEFPRQVLETLRQLIETGDVVIARANAHIRYPCRFMLVAAANPCRCGHLGDANLSCGRAPICGQDYLGRISGPLLDRFDLRVEVPPVQIADLKQRSSEPSAQIAARVASARRIQTQRYTEFEDISVNADVEGKLLEETAQMTLGATEILGRIGDRFSLSARGYHRIIRLGRRIADLASEAEVQKHHIAEAAAYRLNKTV